MAINDQFRFWFDLPGKGITQVFPFNAQLKWTDKRKTGYPRMIQRLLDTPLILQDEPADDNLGFTYLMDLERQGLTCQRVNVTIDRYCDCNDTWTEEWYKGYLRLNAGEWDVSSCRVDMPVIVADAFSCLTNTWTNEINMFDFGDPAVQISPFIGVIEKIECLSDPIIKDWKPVIPNAQATAYITAYFWSHLQTECLYDVAPGSDNHPWTLIKHTHITKWQLIPDPVDPLTNLSTLRAITQIKSQWAREFVAGVTQPDGSGWVAVTGGWARPVNVVQVPVLDHTTSEGLTALQDEWSTDEFNIGILSKWNIIGEDANGNSTFLNGKQLGPLVVDLFAECGLTVISNLFNINPDGTNPDNEYYERAAVDFHELILYQITDIARIDETQSATIALMKVKELVDAMLTIGNADISLDGTTVRIEHESYWTDEVQMDLTLPEFYHLIKERWKYTYDQEQQPKNEVIAWGSETDGKGNDFDGYPIEYDNACANDQEDKTDKTYTATNYLSNLRHIVGNEDYYDDTTTIVMVSTKNLVINSADQPISGLSKLNGNLAMGYLLPRYYDYARPYKEGYINKTLTPMYRSLRLRLQAPIIIPMQCEDYMNNYDPAGLIKTQLGACQIETATYTDPDGTLEVKLRAK